MDSRPASHAGGAAGIWARLKAAIFQVPTTAAGMERAIALVITGLRIGTIVQMAPALARGLEVSQRPWLYGVSWAAAITMAVTVSIVVLTTDRPIGPRLYVLDAAVAVALFLVGGLSVPIEQRVGTWVGFQPGYAISVLATSAAVRGIGVWFGLVAIICADLWFRLPAAEHGNASTFVGNTLTYVVLFCVARMAGHYMRRVAADGDRARAAAAELGRREEEHRAQLAIHNGAAVMRLLADPGLDENVRAVVQREADIEAKRMRSYLQGRSGRASGGAPQDLAGRLRSTAERFSDLPLTTTVDLAEGVVLDGEKAAALDHAVAALLLNVREHAGADQVVLHADAETDSGGVPRWTVTLHDDGRGFDADPARWGVGLREVSHEQLRRHDVRFELTSTPGRGSTVTMSGIADTDHENEEVEHVR